MLFYFYVNFIDSCELEVVDEEHYNKFASVYNDSLSESLSFSLLNGYTEEEYMSKMVPTPLVDGFISRLHVGIGKPNATTYYLDPSTVDVEEFLKIFRCATVTVDGVRYPSLYSYQKPLEVRKTRNNAGVPYFADVLRDLVKKYQPSEKEGNLYVERGK